MVFPMNPLEEIQVEFLKKTWGIMIFSYSNFRRNLYWKQQVYCDISLHNFCVIRYQNEIFAKQKWYGKRLQTWNVPNWSMNHD